MIAFYQGRSLISRAIRLFNWSEFSHAAWIDDDASCFEAWRGRVRHDACASANHTPGTPLYRYAVAGETPAIRAAVRGFLRAQVGKRYDYLGILGFVLRSSRLANQNRWFCSELVAAAYESAGLPLLRLPSYKVYPGMLAASPLLRLVSLEET
jgi:uncharacterized protein YycO